jgi:hypothetical protein
MVTESADCQEPMLSEHVLPFVEYCVTVIVNQWDCKTKERPGFRWTWATRSPLFSLMQLGFVSFVVHFQFSFLPDPYCEDIGVYGLSF